MIYLLKSRVCKKQYVGETTDAIRLKWNNYEDNDKKFQRNESCKQQHFYDYFSSEVHKGFLVNVPVSLIDKTDSFQPKKRETLLKVLSDMLSVRHVFHYCYLGLDCFFE